MVQLISKGCFRERANRSRKYAHSENRKTTLAPNRYQQKETTDTEPEYPATATIAPLNTQDSPSSQTTG